MLVYPRSFWTAIIPRPSTVGDEFDGLPYWDDPPVGITFHSLEDEVLYVYRNPATELERLLKEATQGTGLSDIDYNYALSQNTEGVYVLRGSTTKCTKTDKIRVLLLKGRNEQPTDLLKRNQQLFTTTEINNPYPVNTMKLGDENVHVFNLIEFLADRGLYNARNRGIYDVFVEHAVMKLQKDLKLALTGEYSMWVIQALDSLNREFISQV
jgi:hypothetical protein